MDAPSHPPGSAAQHPLEMTGERFFVVGFSLLLVLIFAVALASLLAVSRLREDGNWVAHTHEVIGKLETILSLATDAETAGRGYALTGQPSYLAPYAEASRITAIHLEELRRLVADNPDQSADLEALSRQVDERLALVERLIDLRYGAGPDAARALMVEGRGKEIHDAIRSRVARMRQREDILLQHRQEETRRGAVAAMTSVVFGSALAIAAIAAALYVIRRDYSGSRKAHAALAHLNARLERLAHHDALTGLPNRLHLLIRLAHTLERARRENQLCAVLYLDLDRFKAVNDTLGHAAGDELLRQAAARMGGRLRKVDTLARLGGDEFVIVLENISAPEDAGHLAEWLVDTLGSPFDLGEGGPADIGTSVGISLFPSDGSHPEELLKVADRALYAAKEGGRNTWRFASG